MMLSPTNILFSKFPSFGQQANSRSMIVRHTQYQRCCYVAAAVLLWMFLFVQFERKTIIRPSGFSTSQPISLFSPNESAGNSTLGFQKILALSRGSSWRTSGLKAAAELTGLDVTIPPQSYISPDIANFFEKNGDDKSAKPLKHGSTIAWLAHIDLLKHVVLSGLSSALILEDDIDFDLKVATQMQLMSKGVRELMKTPDTDLTPYGTNWDVIWMGHCGERAQSSGYLDYRDDSRVTTEGFRGFSKKLWMDEVPEYHRRIQPAVQPICTFAYAVTAASAQRILQVLGSGKDEAYDVGLQHQCTTGHLRCFTIVPQVMQQYEPAEGTGYVTTINEESGFGKLASDDAIERVMGTTSNVVQSARCKALFDTTCLSAGTAPDYWGY